MSVTLAIKEMDTEKALCRDAKNRTVQVFLSDNTKFAKYCEVKRWIDLAAAEKELGADKLGEIKKRNKVRSKRDIPPDKIKDRGDLTTLKPFMGEEVTHWATVENIPRDAQQQIMNSGLVTDAMNAWDMLSLEDMTATCAKCSLSWDKGRGCVATLMGENSPLPEMAKKYGTSFLAGISNYIEQKKVFGPAEAKTVLKEVQDLRNKLPAEGKMMVRRLSGVLDRLEAVAEISSDHKISFYFM